MMPTMDMQPPAYGDEELARRRASSRRLAWILGAIVALIYVGGMFVGR